jgi:protocatechuate 3,4-dioxygenase beta subunit
LLRQWQSDDRAPHATIFGTIVDETTRRPIPTARVFSKEASAGTDDQGRFALIVSRASTWGSRGVPLWIEADGHASGQVQVPFEGTIKAVDRTIALRRDVPFFGTVVDPAGRPVPGAVVQAHVHRDLVVLGGLDPKEFTGGSHGTFQVQTDRQGRFSFNGIPPTDSRRPIFLNVSHPAYQAESLDVQAPTDSSSPTLVRLKPGCTVEGVVVDNRGQPIREACVEVRDLRRGGSRHTAHTDREGRYHFRNVKPGPWRIVVQSERHAAIWAMVVAGRERPVQNQLVLEPGGCIIGRVVDQEGKPVGDASVGWVDPIASDGSPDRALELQNMTVTGSDGTFRIGPLPPGEHQLTALIESPRLTGKASAKVNRVDLVITLTPDPTGGR